MLPLKYVRELYTIFVTVIGFLPKNDKYRILAIIVFQISLAIFDLLGIALIGILGIISVAGLQSRKPDGGVAKYLDILGVSNLSFQNQFAVIAICASTILVARTGFSIYITRKTLLFLGRRSAMLNLKIMSSLFAEDLIQIGAKTPQEISYALTVGVSAVTIGIIGGVITLLADFFLLLLILIALFMIDPIVMLTSLSFFGILALMLYKFTSVKAYKLGKLNSDLYVLSDQKIIEMIDSYREAIVGNRRFFYVSQISKSRFDHAKVLAETQLLPHYGRYVAESGIVVGALLVGSIQFAIANAQTAFSTLSLFLVAATRISPAIMRLQQSLLQIRNSLGSTFSTLNLIKDLDNSNQLESSQNNLDVVHKGFIPQIEIENLHLKYPNKSEFALKNVTLTIPTGNSVAFVGPSGAGKSSLVDTILGVVNHTSGSVLISNYKPLKAISSWPGAISYVPQNIRIINGTIRENICLGYPHHLEDEKFVWQALERAQVSEFVMNLPKGLNTLVGAGGQSISGGEIQRIGIARALFTQPKLLVLDEATSSLDGQTEADISNAINRLKGSVTVIVIAHRLVTVQNVDKVIYMDKGQIVFQGSFEEVRSAVPDFDRQAQLMGL